MKSRYAKAFVATAVLLGMHAAFYLSVPMGEFWPLSRYPMFSRAGRPWSKMVCVSVAPETKIEWRGLRDDEIPGTPVPIDVPRMTSLDFTRSMYRYLEDGDTTDANILAHVEPLATGGPRLLVLAVHPEWSETEPVRVVYTPALLVEDHGARLVRPPETRP